MDPKSNQLSPVNATGSGAIRPFTTPKGGQQPTESGFPGKMLSMLNQVGKADAPKALSEHSIKVASKEDISKTKVDKRLIAALRLKRLNRL